MWRNAKKCILPCSFDIEFEVAQLLLSNGVKQFKFSNVHIIIFLYKFISGFVFVIGFVDESRTFS